MQDVKLLLTIENIGAVLSKKEDGLHPLYLSLTFNQSSFFFWDRRRNRLAGNLRHRAKARGANFKASSALCAFLLVNDMDLVLATYNRLCRTSLSASPTGLALIRVNMVCDQLLAGKSRTPLFLNMRLILISKVF